MIGGIKMKKLLCVCVMSCVLVGLCACGTRQSMPITTEETSEVTTAKETEEVSVEEDTTEEPKETSNSQEEIAGSDAVTPEFKELMDSYEAFFDEYVDFMQKYMKADANDMVAMMADYTEYLKAYTEMMDKMNAIDQNELSTADKLYYIDVTGRINQKLMKVAVAS